MICAFTNSDFITYVIIAILVGSDYFTISSACLLFCHSISISIFELEFLTIRD
jgi:hypothetical protein